jgi:hypothetical protein
VTRRARVVLVLSALWAIWVWAVLVRNMAVDHQHGVAFRLVHLGLAFVSIAFALATLAIVRRSARDARASGSKLP